MLPAPEQWRKSGLRAASTDQPRVLPLPTAFANRIAHNRVLFWQGEAQSREIEVVEGVIRAVRLLPSGGRQILTFFWPGTTIFRNVGTAPSYTAETVTTCILRSGRPPTLGHSPDVSGAHEQILEQSLQLLEAISRRAALSRVAWFLMRIREHLPQAQQGDDLRKFVIPRKDMADHLGLSLETVCRSLTMLKERGVIELPNRKTIAFRNVGQLAQIAKEKRLENR
jgi:CRP-like cAMP-binding protein